MSAARPVVSIVMGSDSDLPTMQEAGKILAQFGVPYETRVLSAHRSPAAVRVYATGARKRGLAVIIAGAGGAAHLAGVVAAHTTLPVIGVPIESLALKGLDSLLSTVQMPPGVPVATVAIGASGAKNAGVLAVQILATANAALRAKLDAYKRTLSDGVLAKDRQVRRSRHFRDATLPSPTRLRRVPGLGRRQTG